MANSLFADNEGGAVLTSSRADSQSEIDFQITSNVKAKPLFYDNGYTVLVDKDRLFEDLKPPTFQSYIVKKPDKERFTELVNEFWWNASYVPKYLWRNELPYAKHMMYCSVHSEFLHTIICWYIGLTNDWSVNPGVGGRHFRKYLDEQLWKEYESTLSDASIENNWKAFCNAVELFTRLAKIITEQLQYDYPSELEHDMKQFFEYIRCNPGKEKI